MNTYNPDPWTTPPGNWIPQAPERGYKITVTGPIVVSGPVPPGVTFTVPEGRQLVFRNCHVIDGDTVRRTLDGLTIDGPTEFTVDAEPR